MKFENKNYQRKGFTKRFSIKDLPFAIGNMKIIINTIMNEIEEQKI